MSSIKLKLSPFVLAFSLCLLLQGCISQPSIEPTATSTSLPVASPYNLATQPTLQVTPTLTTTRATPTNTAISTTVTSTQTLFPDADCAYGKTYPAALKRQDVITETEQIISFTVSPTRTTQGGKMILDWKTTPDVDWAAICYMTNLKLDRSACCTMPLNGSQVIITEQDATLYKFALWTGNSKDFTISTVYGCIDVSDWFFQNPPRQCAAAPPIHSRAVAQQFEYGLMIWVKETKEIMIFMDDHVRWRFDTPLQLKPDASGNHRVGQVPSGFFQPVDNFGLIWRGEVVRSEHFREALGWALEPEFEFDTIYQQGITTPSHFVDGFIRWPNGKIIHFYRQMYLIHSWDEWSSSP